MATAEHAAPYATEKAFAIALAERAGSLIFEASRKRRSGGGGGLGDKKNRVDLVTETDQAVEKMVMEEIRKAFPDHLFIGEESYAAGAEAVLTDAPTWICDPIDGTTNFVHGFPYVCISLSLVHHRRPVVGVIHNPFLSLVYSAVAGQGAFLNSTTRLPLSHPRPLPLTDLGEALIGVEWGSDRGGEVLARKSRSFVRLAGDGKEVEGGTMCHSLRSIGSAAMNYCLVAEGSLDCYWEIGCYAWDVSAGIVIAREAGGKVYGRTGKQWDPEDLMKRHYFVVRGTSDGENEKAEEVQDRIAKAFFNAVEEWEA